MKRILAGAASVALLGVAVLVASPMPTEARDYGQAGQAFPVIEPDLLEVIATDVF